MSQHHPEYLVLVNSYIIPLRADQTMALGLHLPTRAVVTLQSSLSAQHPEFDVIHQFTTDADGYPAIILWFSLHVLLYFIEIVVFVFHHFI